MIKSQKVFNANLEILRGLCAFIVVFHHVFYFKFIANIEDPFLPISLDGKSCVFVFFILSGFVIGISQKQLSNLYEIKTYILKRLIRLYPVYIIGILLTLITEPEIDFYQIGAHLIFLQVALAKVFEHNAPFWSLNYEFLYYLIFIPLKYFKFEPKKVLIASCMLTILFKFSPYTTGYFSSLSLGFIFWSTGYYVSSVYISTKQFSIDLNTVIRVCLILSITALNLPWIAFNVLNEKYHFYAGTDSYIDIVFIFEYPIALFAFLKFINFKHKWVSFLEWYVYITPIIVIFSYLIKGIYFECNFLWFSTLCYGVSLLLFLIKIKNLNVNNIFEKISAMSYAIYILHMPIFYILVQFIKFDQTILATFIKVIIGLIAIMSISFLIEIKFQPHIKNRIYSFLKI